MCKLFLFADSLFPHLLQKMVALQMFVETWAARVMWHVTPATRSRACQRAAESVRRRPTNQDTRRRNGRIASMERLGEKRKSKVRLG